MERVNITLEREDLTLLEELSARTGLSRSAVIREAIHRYARLSTARPPSKGRRGPRTTVPSASTSGLLAATWPSVGTCASRIAIATSFFVMTSAIVAS